MWARSIVCEGPKCGRLFPLVRTTLIVKKKKKFINISFEKHKSGTKIILNESSRKPVDTTGTVKRGKATCPHCGYTMKSSQIRNQLIKTNGGIDNAILMIVVYTKKGQTGRFYRESTSSDLQFLDYLDSQIKDLEKEGLTIPVEVLPVMSGVFNAPIYGHSTWGSLFTKRQAVAILSLISIAKKYFAENKNKIDKDIFDALFNSFSLVIDKIIDMNSNLCVWQTHAEIPAHVFGRWALPMIFDFAETNPIADSSGSIHSGLKRILDGFKYLIESNYQGCNVNLANATLNPLPDNSVDLFFTDPPYYNAVPYADISDFFYIWLKKYFGDAKMFNTDVVPKDEEICEMAGWDPIRYPHKDRYFFEEKMTLAMKEGRRILKENGLGVIVFAHKSTVGWESQITSIISAGWVITASWPIDTEMQSRLRAKNSATLSSSIHIVCRPRLEESVGDWRDVLTQLPKRIHDWMPRLQKEGIVGADAIFACLGPALEIFSQHSKVEKASGELVTLKDYLEHVWAAVAKEALNMIFEDADASGFEEDSRLTAMWLWTLFADKSSNGKSDDEEEQDSEDETEEESTAKKKKITGYVLEYDAARKIAQGLGIHLENLKSVVDVKGETATLLSVGERARHLFNKEDITIQTKKTKRKAQESFNFMKEIEKEESDTAIINELARMNTAETTLDKLHQTMLLFAANRGEAMKRLLVEEGFGRDSNFWKLAQALSALYPAGSDEKRWVDGVLARKKGLDF